MTQLIINGIPYPETSRDKYKCYEKDLGKFVRMANKRLVFEKSGKITVIEYSYDYFADNDLFKTCLIDLRSGEELEVSYLPPESDTMNTEMFRCTVLPKPTFAFSQLNRAYWHNVGFTLEGVSTHV